MAAGRSATLLLAAVLAAVLFVVAWLLPVPYVILSPGPTQDTLSNVAGSSQQLISIRGLATYPTTGHLTLLTVLLSGGPGQQPTLLSALRAWVDHEDAVIPQEFEFPPGQSNRQVIQQDLAQMDQSQQDAVTAALSELHLPGRIEVQSVLPGTPAARVLRPGDQLLAISGHPITQISDLLRTIRATVAGTVLDFTVMRHGEKLQLAVGTSHQGRATVVGFVPDELAPPPASIKIRLQNVGGPSAGMMFALGIIDKLTPGGLTGGRSIAGTGTVDFAGDIGPIGGAQQKVYAALRSGATVFLVPQSECGTAQRVAPPSLRVIPVSTLSGAVADLRALSRGEAVPRC